MTSIYGQPNMGTFFFLIGIVAVEQHHHHHHMLMVHLKFGFWGIFLPNKVECFGISVETDQENGGNK